jgi:hypothetical protein
MTLTMISRIGSNQWMVSTRGRQIANIRRYRDGHCLIRVTASRSLKTEEIRVLAGLTQFCEARDVPFN